MHTIALGQGLIIPERIQKAMTAHLQAVFPMEGCGIMSGRDGRVGRIFMIANRACSRFSYEMDPSQLMRALRSIEADGSEVLALYHSHPDTGAYPSHTDIEQAFFPCTMEPNYPGAVYLIMSLMEAAPELRGYRIDKAGVAEVGVVIDG